MKIKDIAIKAEVSVATVSHVVNKTRYVSAELTERVLRIINESDVQSNFITRNMKALTSDAILCLVENFEDYFYVNVIKGVKSEAVKHGYNVVVLNTDNKGLIRDFIRMEKPCGIIIIPDRNCSEEFFKIREVSIPTVMISNNERASETGNIIIDYYEVAYKAAFHVIKSGHEIVSFIHERKDDHTHTQMLNGYKDALRNNGIPFDQTLVIDASDNQIIEKIFTVENRPTALLSADINTTIELLRLFNSNNINCPDDISLVSFNEFALSHLLQPALTTVAFDPVEVGMNSVKKLNDKLKENDEDLKDTVVPCKLSVRNSTQCISRGPLGEKAESPEVLQLSPTEIEQVKSGCYTAAISFQYSGNAWARLHEKGIKDVFSELGVKVLAVMDAHFDAELQNKQHASILTMNPDVLISIPADEIMTAQSYKDVVEAGTRLVLIDNVPNGFTRDDYATCVSVNQRENGQIAGRILGEHLTKSNKKKIGLIMHGASFFATKQRDMAVEQVLREEFPELEIVAIENFINENNTYHKCYEMIKNHPEIDGLYVSWERPAQEALNALRELNREDIVIVTADLDLEVALSMATGGPIIGLSAQRPYEQGRAMALAAANALIGKKIPSFIGITPYKITPANLLIGWQDILREKSPAVLKELLKVSRS
jgi:ribose transport system substrate-binding protein